MPRSNVMCAFLFALASLVTPASVKAGDACAPAWDVAMGAPGADGDVRGMLVVGEPPDQVLYVVGAFLNMQGQTVNRIAKWDGAVWSSLAGGANNLITALAIYDDGTGPALYAGGNFTQIGKATASRVAKWNGQEWEPLGSGVNGAVTSLVVHDDGSGPALYAGGGFVTAGAQTSRAVARWRNGQWEATTGLGPTGASVNTLAVHDDGSGPALYAGGVFGTAGGAPSPNVAVWRNGVWAPVGTGLNGEVADLLSHDDGAGRGLFVTGQFTATSGAGPTAVLRVAVWRAGAWSPLGAGVTNAGPTLHALHPHDDGQGVALYLGGTFGSAGGAGPAIARWKGGAWESIGVGVTGRVRTMASLTRNGTPVLCVGGAFTAAGGQAAANLAEWVGCAAPQGNPADLNNDGLVNANDLAALLGAWSTSGPLGDVNDDGLVNSADLALLLGAWGG